MYWHIEEEVDAPNNGTQRLYGLSRETSQLVYSLLTADYMIRANRLQIVKDHKIITSYNVRPFQSLEKRELLVFVGFRHYKLNESGQDLAKKIELKFAKESSRNFGYSGHISPLVIRNEGFQTNWRSISGR